MAPIEKLLWWAKAADSIPREDIKAARAELAAFMKLKAAAEHLNVIVEGVRNERWSADGRRLKDTPEWVAFYLALNEVNR
jgi:hypothetical protein